MPLMFHSGRISLSPVFSSICPVSIATAPPVASLGVSRIVDVQLVMPVWAAFMPVSRLVRVGVETASQPIHVGRMEPQIVRIDLLAVSDRAVHPAHIVHEKKDDVGFVVFRQDSGRGQQRQAHQ